jgi:twin BRCT domain
VHISLLCWYHTISSIDLKQELPSHVNVHVVFQRLFHTHLFNSYTQDLNSSRNTHLVAKAPEGAKYDAALKLNSRIVTVGPVWLEDCYQQQSWIDPPLAYHTEISMDDVKKKRSAAAAVIKKTIPDMLIPSLKRQLLLEEGDDHDSAAPLLFIDCQFFLVGFEPEERDLMTSLVGRGHGAIYWELHDSITHVIVKDECDDKLRYVHCSTSLCQSL